MKNQKKKKKKKKKVLINNSTREWKDLFLSARWKSGCLFCHSILGGYCGSSSINYTLLLLLAGPSNGSLFNWFKYKYRILLLTITYYYLLLLTTYYLLLLTITYYLLLTTTAIKNVNVEEAVRHGQQQGLAQLNEAS